MIEAGLFTALGSLTVPVGNDLIRTTGFSTAGKGAAFYRRVPTPSTDECTAGRYYWLRQDAAGAWWKLDEPVPYSDMFGTLGDAAYDHNGWTGGVVATGTPAVVAIQKMIIYTRYFGTTNWTDLKGPGECVISAGKHLIDDSISLTYGVAGAGSVYGSLYIRGEGMNFRGDMNGGTSLLCTSVTRPPFIVQGAEGVLISHMSIMGPLTPWIYARQLGAPYDQNPVIDATDVANWIDPTILASHPDINNRYCPLAAIAVDGYCGAQPTTHYDPITYPDFLGLPIPQPQYNKVSSSRVRAHHCYFSGWVAPMIVMPSDHDGNGDFMGVDDSTIECCLYGISAGNTQCRSITFKDNTINLVHTVVTNRVHGRQLGRMQGTYDNLSIYGGLIQLIDCTPQYCGPMTFKDLYAECIWRIGNWGYGVGGFSNPLSFLGCEFNFTPSDANPDHYNGFPATILSKLQIAHVTFHACAFNLLNEVMVLDGLAEDYSFTGACRVGSGAVDTYVKCEAGRVSANFMAGVVFSISSTASNIASEFSTVAAWIDIDSGFGNTGGLLRENSSRTSRTHNGCAWTRYSTPINNPGLNIPMPPLWREDGKTDSNPDTWHSISRDGRVVTATAPYGITYSTAVRKLYGLLPGSIIWDNTGNYVFRITGVTGAVVTMTLLNGYKVDASETVTIVGDGHARGVAPTLLSLTSGSYFLGNAAIYSPSWYTIGDLAGGTTISNVGRGDGVGTYLTTEFKAGDCLYGNPVIDNALNIAGNLIATSTNGSPGSLTTSLPATITQTRYPLTFLIRGDIPNGASP